MKVRRHILPAVLAVACLYFALVLAGCNNASGTAAQGDDTAAQTQEATGEEVDYLVLVNKENPLPDWWESTVEIIEMDNYIEGDDRTFKLEPLTYAAFEQLRTECLADGVQIELDSCTRTVAEQQQIVDEFTEQYGEDYVRQYVAVPGYSEHHTGLVVDVCLVVDGVVIDDNDDMIAHKDEFAIVHSHLADNGFILRYPEGASDITGYSYEPWHFRYVGSAEVAHEIMDNGLTLEEYLAAR